jgi:YspA, cpYpsA-related SLOG family
MRVLVCGGRDYADRESVYNTLCDLDSAPCGPITCVIHGDARGADRLGMQWARDMGDIEDMAFPADWKLHGRAAGPIRNGEMLARGKPDLVVAFPGGRGTADMVAQAKRVGIRVMHAGGVE